MKITYIHQYFHTPSMAGGIRSYEMARRFVSWGHEVNLITSDRRAENAGKGWFETEEEGIRVHWLPVPYSNKLSTQARIRAFLNFAYAAARKTASLKADVIFATSTPLTVAIPAVYAAKRTGTPMVFEVRDLWPEAPVQMGALTSPTAIAAAKRLERLAYRTAAHIVALSPGMAAGVINEGVPEARVTVVPNASDLELFRPGLDGAEFRQKFGLQDKKVFIYFGTMGPANGLSFVLDGAAELKRRGRNDIAFILHGDGKDRPLLEARKAREELDNVVFSNPDLHKADLARMVSSVDVCMTIYKNVPILYTCSPNKMFDSFSAGKPVLTNMPGWLQSLVEDNQAGVFVRPDDAVDFADKAAALADDPAALAVYGRNARVRE